MLISVQTMVKKTMILIGGAMVLSGCVTSKDAMIPKSDNNMREVYAQHMGKASSGTAMDERMALRRPMVEDEVDLAAYTRTESNHLNSQFTFIPNPVLVMYIAPHLATASEVPIPGYVTQFRMYEKDHYAMPHEMVTYPRYSEN